MKCFSHPSPWLSSVFVLVVRSCIYYSLNYWFACVYIFLPIVSFQKPHQIVAIKAITKKNLAKSQNLLGKEIKILKVCITYKFSFLKMLVILLKWFFSIEFQELTLLQHENVVALLDCKVSEFIIYILVETWQFFTQLFLF